VTGPTPVAGQGAEVARDAQPAPLPAVQQRNGIAVPISAIAWGGAAAVFILLRLGTVWHAPVAGAEIFGLSGAWQARLGVADERFVPTLFQALSALLLHLSSSPFPARTCAFLATATVPLAVFLLRGRLGRAGALLALLLLAFDGPAITLGTSASAMGFDFAITLWLFVVIDRAGAGQPLPRWLFPIVGFGVVTAGPLALPLVAGWFAARLARADYPELLASAWCAVGVVAGLLAATAQFGLGVDGLRVPPFLLFARGYDQLWSTASAFDIALIYATPIVLAGVAAAVIYANRLYLAHAFRPRDLVLLAWTAGAFLWLLSSANAHSAVPVVALTTPLALLVGPLLAEGIGALVVADWRYARYLLPFAAFATALVLSVALKWAHANAVGGTAEQVLVAGLGVIAVAALGLLATQRDSRGTLVAAALAVAAVPFLAGGLGVGFSAGGEPAPSPIITAQAHELRDMALQTAAGGHGSIVVHPSLADAITWPFRDSGTIVIASRVPPDAAFVLWPAAQPQPAGYAAVAGEWSLIRQVMPPTTDFLTYLRWLADRGTVKSTSELIAVYVKAKQ